MPIIVKCRSCGTTLLVIKPSKKGGFEVTVLTGIKSKRDGKFYKTVHLSSFPEFVHYIQMIDRCPVCMSPIDFNTWLRELLQNLDRFSEFIRVE